MGNSLVSIIVPIYNVEKFIKRSIDSLINQTYKNIQIICVDDGSTDGSMRILSEYQDERITIVHKKNGGLSSARNYGLQFVKGDYITFVDSDDWVEPEYIHTLIKQFTRGDIDISCVAFDYAYDDHFQEYEYKMKDKILNRRNALTTLCIGKKLTNHVWNKMYRAYLFSDICFEEGRTFEDIYVMHQLFSKVGTVSVVGKTLYHYYMRSDSILHEEKPQSVADIAVAYIQTYILLRNPIHKFFILRKCAWASYQVLFLINKNVIQRKDLKNIIEFWKSHRYIALLGRKYYLMYKKPMLYKKMF